MTGKSQLISQQISWTLDSVGIAFVFGLCSNTYSAFGIRGTQH